LRGMFAFAIWDAKRRRLFVARDRVGIKPLYFCETGQAFYFASELKAIIADSAVPREINLPGIRKFLAFHYLPGTETLFKGIHKLPAGHTLTWQAGQSRLRQYWDLKFAGGPDRRPEGEIVEELANAGIGCPLGGGFVETAGFNFHQGRFFARALGSKRPREPGRAARGKSPNILPPDERDMFTESPPIQLHQPVTMSIFLSRHPGEQFRRGRKISAERFGKVAIDAGILFFCRNSHREYLRLVQVMEIHVRALNTTKRIHCPEDCLESIPCL